MDPNLLLQQIFFLIPLDGRHDCGPDHAHRLWLGEAVLLHVLPQLGDDLLGALPLGDAVPQAALKLLIIKVEMRRTLLRSKSIHLLGTSVFDG